MRRRDREETRAEEIVKVIRDCNCCRLGLVDTDGLAYIVPLNFAFVENGEAYGTFYFHGAGEGRKIELAAVQKRASFELDTAHEAVAGEKACAHSFNFCSVMGKGDVTVVTDETEKMTALQALMLDNTGRGQWDIPTAALAGIGIIKLAVTEWSCKIHK